jgi:hypothetical protein
VNPSLLDQHFLWASLIWGAIASGYIVYGYRQRAAIPFLGGAAMTAASFFLPALIMSLVCLAIIAAVWWLLRNGY